MLSDVTITLQVRVLYNIPETFTSPNITIIDDRGFGMLYRYWSDAFYQTVSIVYCVHCSQINSSVLFNIIRRILTT